MTRTALRDANRHLLRLALQDRLREPSDFVIFIGGLDVVLDDVGRVDWSRVDALLGVILEERPHLATPNRGVASSVHVDGVSSLVPESDLAITTDSTHEAQGATRAGQGPTGHGSLDHGDPR